MAAAHSSPHRSTPHHPPYAMMIGEAIRELGDAGGPTATAISDYITSHFDGLPWAHNRLFPYFLRKLVASGEFAEPTPGRFLLSSDPHLTPQPPSPVTAAISSAGDHDEPVLQPAEKPTGEHVRPFLTVVALLSPTSVAPPPTSSTTNAGIVIEEHRRHHESTERGEIGRSNAPQAEEPLATCSMKKRKLGATPLPFSAAVRKNRRLGRPSKSSSAASEEAKEAEVTIVTKAKKRRGRPPKSNPEAPLPSSITASVVPKGATLATKSFGGWPPKTFAAAKEAKEAEVTIETKAKKRRGRPPKSKPEPPPPSSSTATVIAEEETLATESRRAWPAVSEASTGPANEEQTLTSL